MIDKIPCKDCNELILPQTAEKTGGICMACKQGIRQSIEQSKELYRKQKEYDPHRELWKHLVKKVHAQENGFDNLTKEEKLYFSVSIFEGEVYNGGIEQFFSNSSGELFSDVVEGLTTLKADKSLSLLKEAVKILFGDAYPARDRRQRQGEMKRYSESEPDGIDRRYYEDPDKLIELLTSYAEKTGLVEPFRMHNK